MTRSKAVVPIPRLLSAMNAFMSRAYIFSMLSENDKAFADLMKTESLVLKFLKPSARMWADQALYAELCIEGADIKIRNAWIHKTKGELSSAVHYSKKGLMLCGRIQKKLRASRYHYKKNCRERLLKRIDSIRAGGYNILGSVNADRGRYKEAIFNLKKYLEIAMKLNDKRMMGAAANNLGSIYDHLGDYDRAIGFHKRALVLTAASADKSNQGLTNNNLGYIYYAKGEYGKAVEYYRRFLQLAREIGSRLGQALALNNLGGTYLQTGDHEKARSHLQEAERLFVEVGDRFTLVETYLFLAELFIKETGSASDSATRLRRAFNYARKARRLADELRSTYRLAGCYLTTARIFTAAKDYRQAGANYEKAIRLFESIDQKRELVNAYSEYAKLIGSAPAGRFGKGSHMKQARYFARARLLCKKMKITHLESSLSS